MKKNTLRVIAIMIVLILGAMLTAVAQDKDTIPIKIGYSIGTSDIYILPNQQLLCNWDSIYPLITQLDKKLNSIYSLQTEQLWRIDSILKMNEKLYGRYMEQYDTIVFPIIFDGTFELINK